MKLGSLVCISVFTLFLAAHSCVAGYMVCAHCDKVSCRPTRACGRPYTCICGVRDNSGVQCQVPRGKKILQCTLCEKFTHYNIRNTGDCSHDGREQGSANWFWD
ncbi:hypothetical protein PTTG_25337 [Puccinia triticina 1-1 BBBD Race 1]|uniref:Secreted protein n=1 Tax=Puccinia triticina (isolate 1-1 / race 1 (BBBD)) TaxID=630390 RepID=A0A180H2Q6_PUCT1|nr:hypothetical protein PTTG_25337 [Puccinia triticina 1-1 BBBD Race 1]WAR57509.1 hypothetical protein PtB15_8B559 [Puccinia triticina]